MKGVFKPNVLRPERNDVWGDAEKRNFFSSILSDKDILILQKLFMTPSIHHITTTDVETGRIIIEMFLKALNYYHHVGCLTVSGVPLKEDTLSLYTQINQSLKDKSFLTAIQDFLIQAPYIDFIWIEITPRMKDIIKEKDLKETAEILTFSKENPVFIIHYSS